MKKIAETFNIDETLVNQRIDQAIAQLMPEYSRSQLKQWILGKKILLDQQTVRPRDKVSLDQVISVNVELEDTTDWDAELIDLNIVFEDEHLILINKPAGLVVHPGAGNHSGTLINALLHHHPDLKTLPRCGIVHRIDKDTTGLLAIAKTPLAHSSLTRQLQDHSMAREYAAIAKGTLIAGGTIEEPIDRHPKSRVKMAVHPMGKEAITHYRIIEKFRQHLYLKINLETGRTHQIRVHFDHIHHPLLGDPVYGKHKQLPNINTEACRDVLSHFNRQALHARKLKLVHPKTKELIEFETPIPDDMQTVLDALRKDEEGQDTHV